MTLGEFRNITRNYSDDVEIKTTADGDYFCLRSLVIEHFEDDKYKPTIIVSDQSVI